jgi:hypothetical protein
VKNTLERFSLALFAAGAAPATIVTAPTLASDTDLHDALSLWLFCFIGALAHAVVLGLPFYLWLKRSDQVNWRTSIMGGFAIGALPIGIFLLPVWENALGEITIFGALGMVGGFSAWLVWRYFPPPIVSVK